MRFDLLLLATVFPFAANGFSTPLQRSSLPLKNPSLATSSRNGVVLFLIDEKAVADSVSVDQKAKDVPIPTLPAPAPPPEPVESATPPPVASVQQSTKPAVTASGGSGSSLETPSISLPDLGGGVGDLPLPAIGVGLLGAFAAVTFVMRGRSDDEDSSTAASATPAATSSPPAPTPAPTPPPSEPDLSIPYDAAAKLAYESSDKSVDFASFKKKYEADAVADVISKQKK